MPLVRGFSPRICQNHIPIACKCHRPKFRDGKAHDGGEVNEAGRHVGLRKISWTDGSRLGKQSSSNMKVTAWNRPLVAIPIERQQFAFVQPPDYREAICVGDSHDRVPLLISEGRPFFDTNGLACDKQDSWFALQGHGIQVVELDQVVHVDANSLWPSCQHKATWCDASERLAKRCDVVCPRLVRGSPGQCYNSASGNRMATLATSKRCGSSISPAR